MLRWITVCALCFLVARMANAQDSISILDFRYPETRAIDWKGGFSANFNQTNTVQEKDHNEFYSATGPSTQNDARGLLMLNSSFLFFHTKEDHDQTVSLSGSFNFNQDDATTETTDSAVVRSAERSNSSWEAELNASWLYLQYFSTEGFHFLGDVEANYSATHWKSTAPENLPYVNSTTTIASGYSVRFNGSLGIGYGRVRDGTFVFRAMRIIERLREDGFLIAPLEKDQLHSLIDRVAHVREYMTNFERYQKYFVQDIVDELTRAGLISPQTVTPFSALRILEAFNENIQPQLFGWRTYYMFVDMHTQSLNDYEYDYSAISTTVINHSINNDWIYKHRFGAEAGYPLSLNTHAHTDATIDLPIHESERRFSLTVNASVIHEVGERVELIGTYQFSRNTDGSYRVSPVDYTKSISHKFLGNFVYFIEDQLQFRTSIGYIKSFQKYFGRDVFLLQSDYKSSYFTFSIGLSYNII